MQHRFLPRKPPNILITIVAATIVIAGIGASRKLLAQSSPPTPVAHTTRHIALGAWTEGLYDAQTETLNPQALVSYEQLTQKSITYAHYYLGWQYLANPALLTQFSALRAHNWTPVLSVNPYYFSGCPVTKLPLYRAIADGKCDTFLHQAGANLSALKEPVYLVFAYEMNNPANSWSVKATGSTNADFVAAWRHIYNVFQAEDAGNVVWVFDPNVPDNTTMPYSRLYPGDQYVDWLGLDGYNWGTTQSWSKWSSFAGVFGASYKILVALAPHKPMMIVEVGSTEHGGNKGAWYLGMLTQEVPYEFPNIQVVIFYNEDRTKQEHVNWLVNTTPQSLAAFIKAIHSPFYSM